MRFLKWIVIGLIAFVLVEGTYLAWRIADQGERAPARIAEILRAADPAIDTISEERIDWLLCVEDSTFWTNDGIDQSTPGAGMTTLSQSLGKLIFFERFSPGFLRLGKLELMALTRFVLVERVTKRDILRSWLAIAYLGHVDSEPVIGFAEGARHYFGKELADLTDREFLSLVAMLPGPNTLDPIEHPSENAERASRIERMLAGNCAPTSLNDTNYERCAMR